MAKEHTTELLLDFGPDGQALVPVVTQDSRTKDVLILAFANREAFDETRRSGYATFWSRSRKDVPGVQGFAGPEQFDAFVCFDETRALEPIGPPEPDHGLPETYPFGV